MQIRRLQFKGHAQFHLAALEIGKGSLQRVPHNAFDSTADAQLPVSSGRTYLDTIESDPAVIVHGRRVNCPGGDGILRDKVPPALFWNSDKVLRTALPVDIGEGHLVVFESTHLLQLFLDPLKLPRFGGQYRTRLQGVDWIFGLS